MSKLYIGNLPFTTTEEDIGRLFDPHGGAATIHMIHDRDTGRFRGFCFVDIQVEDVDPIVEDLDGKTLNGRSLRVNLAHTGPPRRQPIAP